MKIKHLTNAAAALLAVMAASGAPAQSSGESGSNLKLEPAARTNLNRFGLSYRLGFNISAKFKNVGGYTDLTPAGLTPLTPTRPTPDHLNAFNYDDGYIHVDATPNTHPGYTWYYGYDAGVETTLTEFTLTRSYLTQSYSAADTTLQGADGDPQHGLELTFNRQIGALWRGFWGLEAGVGITDLTIQDRRMAPITGAATIVRVSDTFRTAPGVILKPSPFYGTYALPEGDTGSPLVGLTPVGTTTANESVPGGGGTVVANGQLDAQLFSFRIGPYLDVPLSKRWTASLSAGFAFFVVNSDFKFDEAIVIAPSGYQLTLPYEHNTGGGSNTGVVFGGYVSGRFSYAVTDQWSLFAGAQFQPTGDYSHREAGREVQLDLSQAVFATVGLSFSF